MVSKNSFICTALLAAIICLAILPAQAAVGDFCIAGDPTYAYECGDPGLFFCKTSEGPCIGPGSCAEVPELCSALWTPVCGCDGNTYPNECEADRAGVNILFPGECQTIPCLTNEECLQGGTDTSYCEKMVGDCDGIGTCQFPPLPDAVCSHVMVCGCDGQIYPTPCDAAWAGVSVKSYSLADCSPCTDADNDGFSTCDNDCNDNNPGVNPAAQEVCNDGLDNDCDNTTDCQDADCASVWTCMCTDSDQDGYAIEGGDCGPVDCNDTDGNIRPGAVELCDDFMDNNCDDRVDCADSNCAGELACCVPTTSNEKGKLCRDGQDNDCDGFVDELDPACSKGKNK